MLESPGLSFDPFQISLLNQMKEILEDLCNRIKKKPACLEQNLEYAVTRVYGTILRTSRAIYTLILHGYPEEAFGLCRRIVEGDLTIKYLVENNSSALIHRFLDANKISQLQINEKIFGTVVTQYENGNKDFHKAFSAMTNYKYYLQLQDTVKELENYEIKYNIKNNKKFRDYWWAEKNTFFDFSKGAIDVNDFEHKTACNKTHLNSYDCFTYLDNSDSGTLIGETSLGIEKSLYYLLYNLRSATRRVIDYVFIENMDDLLATMSELLNSVLSK